MQKTLDDIARKYCAFEKVDKSEFQRKARILQSLWRKDQDLPPGQHRGRSLGSRLEKTAGEVGLRNFMSDRVREVVRQEVLDPDRSRGKLFAKPRIFTDLLSSQPLSFNLFGELRYDLKLASEVLHAVTSRRFKGVTRIDFEYSPKRDCKCKRVDDSDKSAFDVFVEFETEKKKSFLGIEVKYHENLRGGTAKRPDRYEDTIRQMGCFRDEKLCELKKAPLEQIWRDHLLVERTRRKGYDQGYFMFLYPAGNSHCQAALDRYRDCLSEADSFIPVTLETLLAEIGRRTSEPWVEAFHSRYLDFGKIDRLMQAPPLSSVPTG